MPAYKVKLWYTTYVYHEVKAKDAERAIEQAVCTNLSVNQEHDAIDHLEAMEFNNEVELCDSQYTGDQELEDRERDEC